MDSLSSLELLIHQRVSTLNSGKLCNAAACTSLVKEVKNPIKVDDTGDIDYYFVNGEAKINFNGIHLYKLKGDFFSCDRISESFFSSYDNFKQFLILESTIRYIDINFDTLGFLYLSHDTIGQLALSSSKIRSIYLKHVMVNNLSIRNVPLPESLNIEDIIRNKNGDGLDVTGFDNPQAIECSLNTTIEDISKITFNYINFKLVYLKQYLSQKPLNEAGEKAYTRGLYAAIIERQEKLGYKEGVEKATKEYKEFEYTKDNTWWGYFKNWLAKHWWDYGYKKERVFENSFYVLMLFYLCNLFGYRKLVRDIYPIEEFVQAGQEVVKSKFKRGLRYAIYCLFYTGYIFLGFKLDFKLLKLQNLWLAGWIMFQSILGLVCLAYMANYIISS